MRLLSLSFLTTFFTVTFTWNEICYSTTAAIADGESCGINNEDLFSPGFVGTYPIAGSKGCISDEISTDTNCLCSINYEDENQISDWIWQCNGKVQQSIASGKVCPVDIPVPQGSAPIPCDPTIHPAGQLNDPSCYYSNCTAGGNSTAVCGCISMGADPIWFCVHSTCYCGNEKPLVALGSAGISKRTYISFVSIVFVIISIM